MTKTEITNQLKAMGFKRSTGKNRLVNSGMVLVTSISNEWTMTNAPAETWVRAFNQVTRSIDLPKIVPTDFGSHDSTDRFYVVSETKAKLVAIALTRRTEYGSNDLYYIHARFVEISKETGSILY